MLTATRNSSKNMKSTKKTKKVKPRKRFVATVPAQIKAGVMAEPLRFKTKTGLLIEVSAEIVGPDTAKDWLDKYNLDNRHKDERLIKSFVKKQKKDLWMFNGDTVRFSRKTDKYPDGRLLDGQNRLQSIVDSGIPQLCIVIRGLHEDSFSTMDEGRRRSGSDILSIEKIEEARKKAGIVRSVLLFSSGYYRSTKGGGDRSAAPGNIEILEFARENEEKLDESIEMATSLKEGFPHLNFKMAASMYFMFSKHGKAEAKEFFEDLKKGKKAEDENIKLFASEMIKNENREHKLPYNTILAYFIKTWNAYREGDTIEKLSYDKAEEKFPIPR